MVLHEKGVDFETYEVDLRNKSEEFLDASPTGKVPVLVVDGDSIYESNVINQYLDEVTDEPKLLPQDDKERAYARIWMAFADDFFPVVFAASMGRERGFSEERISKALTKLKIMLAALEKRLGEGREYLADGFSLADIAYAGNFPRLRELAEGSVVALSDYPNVAAWMERIEARESFKAAK
jgi:glutathione S-transferase